MEFCLLLEESLEHSYSSHILKSTFTQDWYVSKTLLVIHTKSKQSRETFYFYDLDFNCDEKLSMIWMLTVMVCFMAQRAGGMVTAGLRARFLTFLLCILCSCTFLGPPYVAKTMVAGLHSLVPHKSVHRQQMTVCPASLTFIREAALSHKQLYQTSRFSSQSREMPTTPGGEEGIPGFQN